MLPASMRLTFPSIPAYVKWGHEAQIGYFPQDLKASIELGMTVNDWLHQFDEDATKEDIRGILGQMLFRGEEGLKMTDALSGGEAARLLFCKLMLQKPNVLVLDEPSNHLDLEAINALNLALQKYEGTVLLVTHDLDLIDEVATRIWHFEGGPAQLPHRGLQRPICGISAADGGGKVKTSNSAIMLYFSLYATLQTRFAIKST